MKFRFKIDINDDSSWFYFDAIDEDYKSLYVLCFHYGFYRLSLNFQMST